MTSIAANILWIAGAIYLITICMVAFLDARGKFNGNATKVIDLATKILATVIVINGIMTRDFLVVGLFLVLVFKDDIVRLLSGKSRR